MSPGIALDAADQAYVLTAEHNVKKLGEEGIHPLFEPSGCDCDTALALDRPTGDLYVDETTRVTEYNLRGALIEQFGVGELTGGAGVAVDAATGASLCGRHDRRRSAVYVFPDSGERRSVWRWRRAPPPGEWRI